MLFMDVTIREPKVNNTRRVQVAWPVIYYLQPNSKNSIQVFILFSFHCGKLKQRDNRNCAHNTYIHYEEPSRMIAATNIRYSRQFSQFSQSDSVSYRNMHLLYFFLCNIDYTGSFPSRYLLQLLISNDPSRQTAGILHKGSARCADDPEIRANLVVLLESCCHLCLDCRIILEIDAADLQCLCIVSLPLRIILEWLNSRTLLFQTATLENKITER